MSEPKEPMEKRIARQVAEAVRPTGGFELCLSVRILTDEAGNYAGDVIATSAPRAARESGAIEAEVIEDAPQAADGSVAEAEGPRVRELPDHLPGAEDRRADPVPDKG